PRRSSLFPYTPLFRSKVAAAAREAGIRMIDAPVSGGTGGAVAGTLTFIVGGQGDDVDAARPILENMGRNIFHAGSSGAGQVAKRSEEHTSELQSRENL